MAKELIIDRPVNQIKAGEIVKIDGVPVTVINRVTEKMEIPKHTVDNTALTVQYDNPVRVVTIMVTGKPNYKAVTRITNNQDRMRRFKNWFNNL